MPILRTSYLIPFLGLLACSTGEDAVTDAPSSLHGLPGLEFTAETLVMESFPVQLRTIVTARNKTGEAVTISHGDPCIVMLRVYDNEARSGEPVWDQERVNFCVAMVFDDEIAAFDTAVYQTGADGYDILGDSLPDGRYWLSAHVTLSQGNTEVPAGVADLAVPRD